MRGSGDVRFVERKTQVPTLRVTVEENSWPVSKVSRPPLVSVIPAVRWARHRAMRGATPKPASLSAIADGQAGAGELGGDVSHKGDSMAFRVIKYSCTRRDVWH